MAKRVLAGLNLTVVKDAVHAAATATEQRVLFVAPTACKVAISYCPDVASVGDNTNTTNLNIVNKGTAGSGTTEIGNLDLPTGVSLTAFDESTIIGTEVALAEGDVLTIQYEKVGTGVLVGPGNFNIRWFAL